MLDLIIGEALPWILGIAVAALGIVGVYFKGSKANEAKHTERRLKGMKEKQEVQKDVQSHTDDDLVDGITRGK